ncbi:MAG: hypothetical protein RLY89_1841, partial [Bacteroidota bacterium]
MLLKRLIIGIGCLLVSSWLSAQAPALEYNKQWKEIDSLIN